MSADSGVKEAVGFDPSRPPSRRQLLLGGGHIAALWALAFVQPLLDLLGKNPDFFVARDNTVGDILILAIGFTLVPPLVLWLIEWAASKLSAPLYHGLHLTFLTVIAGFLFVQVVSGPLGSAPSLVIILISLALALLLVWAIVRLDFVRNLMDILIVAPLVILLLFVFASRTSDVIFPKDDKFTLAKDSGNDHPIVLVIFDELGTAHLTTDGRTVDAERFPNFAGLAETSTWYPDHSTMAFSTPIAVPGILSGIQAEANTLPTWQARPQSIFSQFSRNRPLHVSEPVTAMCPETLCEREVESQTASERLEALWSDLKYVEGRLILPPGIADRLPDVSSNFAGFAGGSGGGDDGPEKKAGEPGKKKGKKHVSPLFVKEEDPTDPETYKQIVEDIPDSRRGLTVMHFSVPHKPWKFDVKGRQYSPSPIDNLSNTAKMWTVDTNGLATAQARMLVQTGFADTLVGMMRQRLEKAGLWDDAIVIVTADHGISLAGGEVPMRKLDDRAMGEVANPPLFIKYPGQTRGEVSGKHSLSLDIVPTIAQAVGVKKLYETDGVPLQGPVPDREVTLTDGEGATVSKTVDEMVEQRDAAVKLMDERVGTGPFYTLGAMPDLIGRPVDPVPAGAGQATLDKPGRWSNYRPARDLIPMFITGTTTLPLPDDPADAPVIAIAVNGKVRGSGKPFEFNGATRFGALVDPKSLRPGRNEIGFYRVDGHRLVPIGGS